MPVKMYYRIKELAQVTGLSESAVLAALHRGEFRAVEYRVAGSQRRTILIPSSEVEQWTATFSDYEPRGRQAKKRR